VIRENLWFIAAALFLFAGVLAIATEGGLAGGGALIFAMACFVIGLTQRKR
jgi:hypothetical protein